MSEPVDGKAAWPNYPSSGSALDVSFLSPFPYMAWHTCAISPEN